MNSYDSDRILESIQHSHAAVSRPDQADVIVFNTCHIREKAAEKIYSEVGMLKELKENNKDIWGSWNRIGSDRWKINWKASYAWDVSYKLNCKKTKKIG